MPSAFASILVFLRHLVVVAWIAAAAATAVYLPGLGSGEALELGGLLPEDSPAIEAGERSQELFPVPLTADTAVVERDPEGFSAEAQAAIVRRAVDVSTQEGAYASPSDPQHAGALPRLGGRRDDGGHAPLLPTDVSLPSKVDLAREYAAQSGSDHYAGVTGPGRRGWRSSRRSRTRSPGSSSGPSSRSRSSSA